MLLRELEIHCFSCSSHYTTKEQCGLKARRVLRAQVAYISDFGTSRDTGSSWTVWFPTEASKLESLWKLLEPEHWLRVRFGLYTLYGLLKRKSEISFLLFCDLDNSRCHLLFLCDSWADLNWTLMQSHSLDVVAVTCDLESHELSTIAKVHRTRSFELAFRLRIWTLGSTTSDFELYSTVDVLLLVNPLIERFLPLSFFIQTHLCLCCILGFH